MNPPIKLGLIFSNLSQELNFILISIAELRLGPTGYHILIIIIIFISKIFPREVILLSLLLYFIVISM